MFDFIKGILIGQFEAGLCMMNRCIELCPADHWEGKIGNDSFRQVTYHTLFYVDCYLSLNEDAFQLQELHHRAGNELVNSTASLGLSQIETPSYVTWCRQKCSATFAAETFESLQGRSGFHWLKFSRAEAHLYNIRHLQHHTGQLSAYLRRHGLAPEWVSTGWRTA